MTCLLCLVDNLLFSRSFLYQAVGFSSGGGGNYLSCVCEFCGPSEGNRGFVFGGFLKCSLLFIRGAR